MNKPLDGNRLKDVRTQLRLSQDELAARAKLSKETIHRLERGRQSGMRQKTLSGLATALGVEPGVLTGELPAPLRDEPAAGAPDAKLFETYPLNYRVDGAVRNAFTLAALRYRIPIARIVELAPLLFVIAAENSLKRRTEKLDELEAVFECEEALQREFKHLTPRITPFYLAEGLDEERESIARCDLLASEIPFDLGRAGRRRGDEDEAETNPFVFSLKAEAERHHGIATMERFDRHDANFKVCPKEALELAAGDKELADYILDGRVVLHSMPRELLAADAAEARIPWLQKQKQEYDAAWEASSLPELSEQIDAALDAAAVGASADNGKAP
jgi:transcriptional regulator with XRE-family HTH domain